MLPWIRGRFDFLPNEFKIRQIEVKPLMSGNKSAASLWLIADVFMVTKPWDRQI